MNVLREQPGGHSIGIDGHVDPSGRLVIITKVSIVVENGDGSVVIMPTGIVLRSELSGLAIG